MALPSVRSIRSGRKQMQGTVSVTGSAGVATALESITAAVTWTDEFGSLKPRQTVCGHVSSSTVTLLESAAGETYCASCFAALKQLVTDYDSERIDSTGAAARLRGLGFVRREDVPRFLQQLTEPAMSSDRVMARGTMRRLRDEQMIPDGGRDQDGEAETSRRSISVACARCGRRLLDDPRTWHLGHFDANQLGLELLATRSAPRPPYRLDLPEVRGGLVRPGVDILIEDLGQERGSQLNVRPHPRPDKPGRCLHSPSIGFAELVAACTAAELAGKDHIEI